MANAPKQLRRKLVCVGDMISGKTALLTTLIENGYPDRPYLAMVNHCREFTIDQKGTIVDLALWDTADLTDFDRLLPLSYSDTHVALLCFSVGIPETLDNILTKWAPQVREHCGFIPIILVGCMTDMRDHEASVEHLRSVDQRMLTVQDGKNVAKHIDAEFYFECSAKNDPLSVIEDLFERAAKLAASVPASWDEEKKSLGQRVYGWARGLG
ncbi:P-loop containing nucleoside triphosphate hydrolase protein [Meredithblackwellia eburnea MCA 4105]